MAMARVLACSLSMPGLMSASLSSAASADSKASTPGSLFISNITVFGTAGSAVFFAGLTVLIALTALTVIGIAVLSTMALVAASTVALAVLIALSLLPALLGLVGERICSDKARARRRAKVQTESHGVADHWVRGVVRFRWPVIAGVAAILVVMAIPAASMNLGIPSGATANQDTAARQSYEAVSQSFGEGFNSPLLDTQVPISRFRTS